MRRAILVITLAAAVAAEAPYHLPRPAAVFNYAPQAPPPSPHLSPFSHQPSYSQSRFNHAQLQSRHQPQFHHSSSQSSQQFSVGYPRPQQVYQQPSFSYRQPQIQQSLTYTPQVPIEHIRPLPALLTQQHNPVYYQQPQISTGQSYSYQQPQSGPFNNFLSSPLSSYQADSKQYNTPAQVNTHSDALDPTVVNHVQNIIKETEHTSAKEAGYLSLVSGVTLENVKPSIEITSFVQNSPLLTNSGGSSSISSSSSSSSAGAFSISSAGSTGQTFLPRSQPASSYGPPN